MPSTKIIIIIICRYNKIITICFVGGKTYIFEKKKKKQGVCTHLYACLFAYVPMPYLFVCTMNVSFENECSSRPPCLHLYIIFTYNRCASYYCTSVRRSMYQVRNISEENANSLLSLKVKFTTNFRPFAGGLTLNHNI